MKIVVADGLTDLGSAAADAFGTLAARSKAGESKFTVALSGGSTPVALYDSIDRSTAVDPDILYFFGDERNVPSDDEQSNFRTANESLFKPAGVAGGNIFRWRTELIDPQAIASDYEDQLYSVFPVGEMPRFSLILLGIGADGHTASLFPDTAALNVTDRPVVQNYVEKLKTWRFTMTYPLLNNAEHIFFLVSGKEKASAVRDIILGNTPERSPASGIVPANGDVTWFLDRDSASLIPAGYI